MGLLEGDNKENSCMLERQRYALDKASYDSKRVVDVTDGHGLLTGGHS